MDAIMATLAAVLLANADGHIAQMLAALLRERRDRRRVVILFFSAFTLLAIMSAVGALVAARHLGLGVLNLFAGIALVSAAAALLWTRRGAIALAADAAVLVRAGPVMLFVRLFLMQLGDRNQFLILALGGLSGAALWGVAGGAAGLLVAMLPVLALGPALFERRGVRRLRWAAAALLVLWAFIYLRRAFGV